MKIFEEIKLGELTLSNRIVMAPMTRSRAINNIPNDLMATYYRQRASAGLIITEGVAPSPNGLGYARIPGAYSAEQVEGWKLTTDAVHNEGGKIFMQIMHTGRISHALNMPEGAIVMAPSAIPAKGQMYTDQEGMLAYPVPQIMTKSDIDLTVQEYAIAAKNAIFAGFDGVEIHGANGYLVDQFFNPRSNHRTDEYGGSDINRSRFALEVVSAIAGEIGPGRTGIRISPYNTFNDLAIYDSVEETYKHLAFELGKMGLAYIHMIDVGNMGGYDVPMAFKEKIKAIFKGPVIINGGLDKAKAEQVLKSGIGDMTSFGTPFIANPDLVERLKNNVTLSDPDPATFYTPGKEGYSSYPTFQN
jgi:N-ethylmaleimide reductase